MIDTCMVNRRRGEAAAKGRRLQARIADALAGKTRAKLAETAARRRPTRMIGQARKAARAALAGGLARHLLFRDSTMSSTLRPRMTRLALAMAAGLFLCGFTLTPEYEKQAREEVAFCAAFARRDAPAFDAAITSIDRRTGELRIERANSTPRGEVAFANCLAGVRKGRLVERHLPKTADPTPPTTPPQGRYAVSGDSVR